MPEQLGDEELLTLLQRIEEGDPDAFTDFWNEFRNMSFGIVKARFISHGRMMKNESDLVAEGIKSTLSEIANGRFDPGEEVGKTIKTSLRKILVCKVCNALRWEHQQKRDISLKRGESALMQTTTEGDSIGGIEAIESGESIESPTTFHFAYERVVSELRKQLSDTDTKSEKDRELLEIFDLALAEKTNKEIATAMGISAPNVSRKLKEIRITLSEIAEKLDLI